LSFGWQALSAEARSAKMDGPPVARLFLLRVRIMKPCPPSYGGEGRALLVGRVYNLPAALASALLLEDCAELYDALSPAEKRERSEELSQLAWTAEDRQPQWNLSERRKRKKT
jgi:hypothetical protein